DLPPATVQGPVDDAHAALAQLPNHLITRDVRPADPVQGLRVRVRGGLGRSAHKAGAALAGTGKERAKQVLLALRQPKVIPLNGRVTALTRIVQLDLQEFMKEAATLRPCRFSRVSLQPRSPAGFPLGLEAQPHSSAPPQRLPG